MNLQTKYDIDKKLDRLIELCCVLFIPAIIYSKALITICYLVFVLLAIGKYLFHKKTAYSDTRWRTMFLFGLAFLSVLLSGWNSDNQGQWIQEMTIRLPVLTVPLCFYFFSAIDCSFVRRIHVWLIVVLAIASVPVMLTYAINVEHWVTQIGLGKSIPTPIEHVKYSMFNAYGVISGLLLLLFHKDSLGLWGARLLIAAVIALAIYMHLLAVRTGLVILYLCCFILLLYYFIRMRSFVFLGLSIVGISIIGFLAIKVTPTLKTKIEYMVHDWKMYQNGEGNLYNDSDRLQSLQVGWKLFKRAPLVGVGAGDLREECAELYDQLGRAGFTRYPHNQFLYVLAGTGLLGFVLFIIGLYGPIAIVGWRASSMLSFLYLNYSLSFLVENSLERSISMGFFIVFASMMIIAYLNKIEPTVSNELF